MNISPVDIRKQEFRKSIRGFDQDEVLAFQDMVANELERAVREISVLAEKNTNLENQMRKYRDLENALQETLVSAQKTREDTLKNAEKEAELIIREAEIKAAAILEESRADLSRVRNSFHEARAQKDAYIIKMKAIVKSQLELLETPLEEEKAMETITEPEREEAEEMPSGSEENNPLEGAVAKPGK